VEAGRPPADGDKRRERKPPRRITADYLQRAAMHYLERYSAPAAQLRRVLARKVALSCRFHGDDPTGFSRCSTMSSRAACRQGWSMTGASPRRAPPACAEKVSRRGL
jgi:hypothetical protein